MSSPSPGRRRRSAGCCGVAIKAGRRTGATTGWVGRMEDVLQIGCRSRAQTPLYNLNSVLYMSHSAWCGRSTDGDRRAAGGRPCLYSPDHRYRSRGIDPAGLTRPSSMSTRMSNAARPAGRKARTRRTWVDMLQGRAAANQAISGKPSPPLPGYDGNFRATAVDAATYGVSQANSTFKPAPAPMGFFGLP